jgi:acyl transferase domain-containing protein
MVVKVETMNQCGRKVLEGTAEVAQATTVYLFTGQGSQEAGVGMDLYSSSPAARAVWDGAETYSCSTQINKEPLNHHHRHHHTRPPCYSR